MNPIKLQDIELDDASIACGHRGQGPDLLFIHGVPTHSATWRHLVNDLSADYRCWVVDLPGFGESRWDRRTDFRFVAQADRLLALVNKLGIEHFGLVAHDTGATIARLVALGAGAAVRSLSIINTEIPGHRPPWIQIYQALGVLPGVALSFQQLLKLRAWRRSGMALGGCFVDKDLLDGEFHQLFIQSLIEDRRKVEGMIRYLRGIQWDQVDAMAHRHAEISAPTQAIWGEQDPTFPVDLAEAMMPGLANNHGLTRIPGAALLPQEEQPAAVLAALRPFLASAWA